MAEPAMQLIGLKKQIGSKLIVKGLDFDIRPGEVFGFLGPNGAGKTTTIRMMVGLIRISEGDVRIQGKSIKSDFKGAIGHVGAIVENPELYGFMSGYKNLLVFSRMIPGITRDRIDEVVKLVGLEKTINQKVKRYSLGMRQRLGIAQALLHRPSILILDEPTNGLDPSGIREIRHYIRKLAEEENVAVIVSSHLLSEMELMCDRIGILKNGELISIQEVHSTDGDVPEEMVKIDCAAAQIETAKQLLQEQFGIAAVDNNDQLLFPISRDQMPPIIKALAVADIEMYGVAVERKTLEDKFLHVIGENVIE
ncbi:ABC-2 type transport system ATP-binding protein [Terribacillus aidingensis]|uniref:ABC-2 type transport system ATP-binding protein n=1 Tax=Terribacillus aidingensis TaxID=586416 RepID=A0A285P691_9BACI|nr:ABC transporter ATP-binding protein [Terribacillus aidingensis]SNZ16968.1 ABC-2 type transport system ATP-binding protein [Terribacillus aidingensis]